MTESLEMTFIHYKIFFKKKKIKFIVNVRFYRCIQMMQLVRSNKEFKAKVKIISLNKIFNHHMIHRKATATQSLQPFINKVLQDTVCVVNFIKSKTLTSITFIIICNKIESDHTKCISISY